MPLLLSCHGHHFKAPRSIFLCNFVVLPFVGLTAKHQVNICVAYHFILFECMQTTHTKHAQTCCWKCAPGEFIVVLPIWSLTIILARYVIVCMSKATYLMVALSSLYPSRRSVRIISPKRISIVCCLAYNQNSTLFLIKQMQY